MDPLSSTNEKGRRFVWRNIAVCFIAGTLAGGGCQHLVPSVAISSDPGIAVSLILMTVGPLLLVLVRGFDRKNIRRAEILTVVAAFSGQIFGMVGEEQIRDEIVRWECGRDHPRYSCVPRRTPKVDRPPPGRAE
jgi:hypothetical protein